MEDTVVLQQDVRKLNKGAANSEPSVENLMRNYFSGKLTQNSMGPDLACQQRA